MAAGLGFKDFTTGEVLTAADVDGYLMQGIWVFADSAARDAAVTSPQEGNFAFLKDTNTTTYYTGSAWTNLDTTGMVNPMTTTGDMIYSSSGSTPARLGIGTAGQVLKVNSGATAPEWGSASSSFVGALAYMSSGSVTYVANVEKILTATSEEFDTDGFHSTSTNTERMTIPAGKGGKYLINAHHRCETGGDYAYLYLFKNGARVTNGLESGQSARQVNMASNSTVSNFSVVVDAVATDYFYITFQSSFSATSNTWFRYSITYLGA